MVLYIKQGSIKVNRSIGELTRRQAINRAVRVLLKEHFRRYRNREGERESVRST